MKIVMGASPRNPDQKPHWTVTFIRAFGIVQIVGAVVSSFLFLSPLLKLSIFAGMGASADVLSIVCAVGLGLIGGFMVATIPFALATLIDDLHTVRGYLRDMQLTGKYYDE